MPITWCYEVADEEKRYCSGSFPIGCFVTDQSMPMDACVISVRCILLLYHVLNNSMAVGIVILKLIDINNFYLREIYDKLSAFPRASYL